MKPLAAILMATATACAAPPSAPPGLAGPDPAPFVASDQPARQGAAPAARTAPPARAAAAYQQAPSPPPHAGRVTPPHVAPAQPTIIQRSIVIPAPQPAAPTYGGACTPTNPCVGPRGGVYYLTPGGNRVYLRRR